MVSVTLVDTQTDSFWPAAQPAELKTKERDEI